MGLKRSIFICILFFTAIQHVWSQKVFFSGNDFNSIFLCENGNVYISGENTFGQLGNGNFTNSNLPVQVTGIDGVGVLPKCKQVQIEGFTTYLALTQSGDTVVAWGLNDQGQVGDGTTGAKNFPVRVKGINGVGYLQDIVQIATGNSCSYAITEEGKVLSWGGNFKGQLGNGTVSPYKFYPDYVLKGPSDTLKMVKSISAGGVFCTALLCDGTVWAWGQNDWGELGQNSVTTSPYAVQVKNSLGNAYLSNIIKVEAGDNYCFAISANDTLWAWGANTIGQLGIGNTGVSRLLPTYTKSISGSKHLSSVIDVAAGQGHAVAVLSDNSVVAWGSNSSGQLGVNNTTGANLPVQVKNVDGLIPMGNINYVAAGDVFSIARTSSGQVYVWGDNSKGQLGMGDYANRLLPSLITLPCQPTTDVWPGFGTIDQLPNVCSGNNSGTIFLNKNHLKISGWQQSSDNFSSFSFTNTTDFSLPYNNLTTTTLFRAVLRECANNYYSPVATIFVDSVSQPGIINSSQTVLRNNNKDTLHLSAYTGSVLQWEYSRDNFVSDINQVITTSNSFVYSDLTKSTYYRVLVKSGVCQASYSDTAAINVIDENDIKIYKVFTPNGDRYNDEWIIDFIELFPDNKVEIYNRWGQLVFKEEHYNNEGKVWKGESNVSGTLGGSVLEDGTYFYTVDLGKNYSEQKGYVVIAR